MKTLFKILIPAVVIGFVFSCRKPKKYSDIPEIHYKSFYLRDTNDQLNNVKMGTLTFSFIDGDGDIGLRQGDTFPPYDSSKYNLFTTLFQKTDSGFEEIHLDNPNYRLPYIDVSEGQNKTVKGDIKIDFTYNYPLKYHTIKYKFYIMDRAFHKSNTDSTGEIVLKPD
ncbi:MAG: hypothetical protein HY958_12175 [Bacteroidia bacterium]|nr:hypothetical protein [Bacteroidia bacterium]